MSRAGGRDVEADGGTAADQEARCRAQLVADGYEAGEVFIDLDVSGGKASRPEFDKALARIEAGESGGLVTFNLKRFGRKTRHVLATLAQIEAWGGVFISVSEKLDTSSPYGRFALTILAAVGELELDTITAQWARTQASALERGVYVGATPTGYTTKPDGTLVKNGGAAKIAQAYEIRANGGSWSDVARALDGVEHGRRAPGGAWRPGYPKTKWTKQAAHNLLAVTLYKGVLGRLRDGTEIIRPELAVVTPSLWDKAQPTPDPDRKGGRRDGGKALLAGLLRCEGCGRALTLSTTTRGGKAYSYYSCKSGRSFCSAAATLRADEAEAHVEAVALDLFARRPITYGSAPDTEKLTELEHALAAAKAERLAGVQVGLDPDDPDDAAEISRLRLAVESAAAALKQEASSRPKTARPAEIRKRYEKAPLEERRHMVRLALGGPAQARRGREPVSERIFFGESIGGEKLTSA